MSLRGGLAGKSVSVAERSAQLLAELVPSIKNTAELVQDVAAASTEQSSGVTQINQAMSQVDTVTQRNASSAEELSSTAEELAAQSEQLQQLMTFFHLSGTSSSVPRAAGASRTLVAPVPLTRIPAAALPHNRPTNGKPAEEHNFTAF